MKRSIISLIVSISFVSICFAAVNPVSLQALMQKDYDGRDLKLGQVLDSNDVYTRYYTTYMSDKYKISGIMNVPKGEGPFPVIITAHGYINTKYYTNGRGLKREQDYLARRGYIVIHPDYRNHNGSDKDPDNAFKLNIGYTEDVINAIYAVKSSDMKIFDKDNIGMLGHSLGGGIALNIMVAKPGLVKAYVLFAPISSDYKENYYRWIARHNAEIERTLPAKYGNIRTREELINKFGTPEKNPAFWRGISVKYYIDKIKDPVIAFQGLSDKDVPYKWTEELESELKNKGKNIEAHYYKGEGHEFSNAWPAVMKRSVTFYDEYLKK